jgi:DNA-binding NarL/FixJ family response regulator
MIGIEKHEDALMRYEGLARLDKIRQWRPDKRLPGQDISRPDERVLMRILVADDDRRVRSALEMLLRHEPGLTLIGQCTNLEGLLVQARKLEPDLVLLDWELPGRSAADLLSAFQQLGIRSRVIVLSASPESERVALMLGADAFVSKADPPDRLLSALHQLSVKSAR